MQFRGGLEFCRKTIINNIYDGTHLKTATFERIVTYILKSRFLNINNTGLSEVPADLIIIISGTMTLSKYMDSQAL